MDLSLLSSGNWQERKQTLESLSYVKESALAAALLEMVREHPNELTSLNAALQLLHLIDAPVVPGLVSLLRDEEPEIQAYAALVLGQIKDPEQRPTIIAALMHSLDTAAKSENTINLRFNIIEALGRLKASQAVDRLLEILTEDNFFLSFGVIHALGEIGDSRAQATLLSLIDDEMLDYAAIGALKNAGDLSAIGPIANWLGAPKGDATVAAPALAGIIRNYGLPGSMPEKNTRQLIEIGYSLSSSLNQEALDKLLSAAQEEESPETDKSAHLSDLALVMGVLALAEDHELGSENTDRANGSETFAALMRLLKNPNSYRDAASSLVRLGKHSIPWLVGVLQPGPDGMEDETDCIYRREAALALGRIGDPAAVPHLEAALKSGEAEVVTASAESLGEIGGEQAATAILSQIGHPSAAVRKAVTKVLQSIQEFVPVSDLILLLESADPLVKEAAIHLLAARKDISRNQTAVVPLILEALGDHHLQVRRAAVEALPFFKDPQIPSALTDALQRGEPELRAAAARSLASCSPAFALPLLYTALQDEDPWIRMYACRSVGKFQKDESIPYILPLLEDRMPPVRAAAAEAIGIMKAHVARKQLQSLLSDEEPEVQQAAEAALADLRKEKE